MGSGKRKDKDQTIIRIPKSTNPNISIGIPEKVADFCKPSFEQHLNYSTFLKGNQELELVEKDNVYKIFLGGEEIATLSSQNSKMVKNCLELGVKYKGKVVVQKDEFYGRFVRVI